MFKVVLAIFLFLVFNSHADTHTRKRIFILHSYSGEYEWTKLQHESFVKKLQESCSSPLEISVEYLDTKRLKFSSGYQSFFLAYLQKKYESYSPDAIYVTDDNALQFFLKQKSELFSEIPIFFSGINDLSLVHTIDQNRYTGVYETKDIVPNIELIRQFSPQTREIWIVGDGSNTYRSIEEDIKSNIAKYPKYTFHFLVSSHINEITTKLPNSPRSFVLLTTIGELSDADGHKLTPKESIDSLRKNSNIIICSMEDAYLLGGVVGGFVTSGTKQGSSAAELVIRYFRGEPLNRIHSLIKSPNVYMFDHEALVESRLILSEYIARGAVIIHREKTFFEHYQETILSVIFILFALFLLFAVLVFFVTIQKNAKIKKLETELQENSAELLTAREKLFRIEEANE